MSVLVDIEIKKLTYEMKLIEHFEEASLEAASYDLRLGSSYMRQGVVKRMTDEEPSVAVQPGEYIIITSHETLNFPLDLVAHFGLMSPWGMKGIVSLFGPQIDPGFSGILVVPIFNAGDSPITLPLLEKMFTVEFIKTSMPTSKGWADKYGKQTRIKSLHTAFQSRPNLADVKNIKDDLESVKSELENMRLHVHSNRDHIEHLRESKNWYLAFWGAIIAIVSLIVGNLSSTHFVDGNANSETKKEQISIQKQSKENTSKPSVGSSKKPST